jgi:hypothetical protein
MRACDREKSESLVHSALKEFPTGIGLWYMGRPRANMVAEVQFIGSPGDCLHCLLCAPALAQFYPAFHCALFGRRTAIPTRLRVGWDRRVCTPLPRGYIPLRVGRSVG